MEDYNKVLDATEVAENANGVAAEKMTVYNESLAAAQNRLTASIQQFAQDSNLDQILALAYDGLSKVVEILNILLNKIPILSPLIKAMGVALATAFAGATIKNMIGASDVLGSIVKAAPGVINALSQMASGAAGFGAVVTAAGGPVTIILSALAAIVALAPAVVSAFNEMFPSAEQRIKNVTEAFESAQQEVDTTQQKLDEINSKIKEIDAKGTLTLADKNEKQKLEEQRDVLKDILQYQKDIAGEKLREQKEEYGRQYTEKYSSKGIDTSEQYSYITTGVDPYASEYSTQIEPYIECYDTENASVEQLMANLQKLGEERRTLSKEDEDYGKDLTKNNELTQENITALKQRATSIGEDIAKMQELKLTNTDYYKNAVEQFNQIKAYVDPSSFEKIQLSDLIETKNIKEKLQEAVQAGDEAGKQTAENYANQFAQEILAPNTDASIKESWAKAMDIDKNDLNVDNLTQEILIRFQQMFGDIANASNSAAQSFTSQSDVLESYQNEIIKIHDSTTDLTAAYQDMIDKGYLSETVVKNLIKAHPELTKQLKLENGQYKINIETLKEANDAAYNESIATIKSQKEETQVVIDSTWDRIRMVNREIRALKAKAMVTGEEADYTKYVNAERELGDLMTQMQGYTKAIEEADAKITQLEKERDAWSPPSKKSSSAKSAADQAAKEFENQVKDIPKQLKTLVTLYSKEDAWNSPEVIANYKEQYQKMLDSVVNDPKARKILAEAYNLDITDMSVEDQIKNFTTLIEEQASTIDEARQKLQENYLKGLKEAEEAEQKQYEEAKKQIEALNKMTQDMIETAIDLLDKAGSFVFSLLDKVSDRYDKQIDNLDKIMDDLDDQKDAFDDKIDAQKEYLKLQKEEIDNQKELAEKTQSIADIDARLIEMQYDDSAAAQAERLKLLDERAKKEKELKDFQDETAYDAQMNALDAQKKQFDAVIETQKKALEQQKQALEESQKKFENTVSSIKSAFDGFIKILNSTVFKNLATNLLNSIDGETLNKALSLWNSLFGTGLQSDVTSTWDAAYGAATKYGWQPGKNLQETTSALGQGISTKESNVTQIEQAQAANKAGDLNLADSITSGLKIDSIQKKLDQVTTIFNNTKTTIGNIMDSLGKGIESIFGNVGTNIIKFANGIGGSIQSGIQNAANIFDGLGQTLQDVFKLDWSGITGSVSEGLGIVSNVFSKMFNPVANGASAIGDAIGAGVTGFFPGIFTALSTLVTTVGTAMTGLLTSIATTLASIPVVGWALAAIAFAGIAGLVASIANVSSQTKSAKVAQPTQSFHAKKHHSGADYVKKENPELDKMLGLNDDETVSILKVGEAVVPTWANTATSSASSNIYTGETATRAVDTAKQATRTSYSASGGSSVVNTISMPITIQGSADDSTVKALKEQSEKIAKTVFKLINKQTNMSGYRNVKAATI